MKTREQEVAAYTYLTPQQMARRLACTPAHVNELIRAGKIAPAIDIAAGGRASFRVAPVVFEAYLNKATVQPQESDLVPA